MYNIFRTQGDETACERVPQMAVTHLEYNLQIRGSAKGLGD